MINNSGHLLNMNGNETPGAGTGNHNDNKISSNNSMSNI